MKLEVTVTKCALTDVTNTQRLVQNERNCLQKKVSTANCMMICFKLRKAIKENEILKPLVSVKCETDEKGQLGGFTFHTKRR